MNRPLQTALFSLLLIALFMGTSVVHQSCGKSNKKMPDETSIEDKVEQVADQYTDEEYFEEDEDADENVPVFDDEPRDDISTRESSSTRDETAFPSAPPKGGYLVIAGNYLLESNADIMVENLRNSGFRNAEKVVFDLSQYYTVLAGRYESRSLANSISSELNAKGIDNYVLSRN